LPSDPVAAYAHSVVDGKVITGRLVNLACQRHLSDLEQGPARGLRWNLEEAERALGFFGHLKQSKGRWAGEGLVLLAWQQFVIGSLFGWQRYSEPYRRWIRRFRRSFTSVAKKNGKTTASSGVALYLLDFDGEPGAEIFSAASKRDQARLSWDEAAQMVFRTPSLKRRIKVVDSRAHMYVAQTASKYVALGHDADSTDGINPHAAIIDELHRAANRDLIDVIEDSTAARTQPLIFYITTAGLIGESIYDEIDDYSRRVVEGVEDDGWFGYTATLDQHDDWRDDSLYIKANPSLGVTVQIEDLRAERDRAVLVPGRQNPFRRLRLNQRTEQAHRWLDLGLWDAQNLHEIDEERLHGRHCYGGLDLASVSDLTAWALVFPQEDDPDALDVLIRAWCPESRLYAGDNRWRDQYQVWKAGGFLATTPGESIDYGFVRKQIMQDAERFQIVDLNIDRLFQSHEMSVKLAEEGLTLFGMGQGFMSMTTPSKELERRLLARKLNHGRNPLLRWSAGNVAVRQDPAGNLKPDKSSSQGKIDPIVALIMALDRAMRNSGPSVYETRGILTV
jgi:phage terminase large subunit-like protein